MYPSLSHMQLWFRESSLLFVMPCALSHSIVKVILEVKVAEMEANYKKACKKHALATYARYMHWSVQACV